MMGEVVPAYFFSKHAAERIQKAFPDAQIVVSLRDPVKRAISHYLHLRKYGFTDLEFEPTLERFPHIVL